LEKVVKELNVYYPDSCFTRNRCKSPLGSHRREFYYPAAVLTALLAYPGNDVVWEMIPILVKDGSIKGLPEFFDLVKYLNEYQEQHTEHTYLIINSDTCVRVETYEGEYPFKQVDTAEKEYNKMLKKPCPDNYIEFRMENRSGFLRVPKEMTDGKVSVDGVPLDLYECIRFDPGQNAYIIMDLPRYDMPLPVGKIQDYEIFLDLPDFTWDNRIIPKKDKADYPFPGIPRIDVLHQFLNRMEPTHAKFMKEDFEAVVQALQNLSYSFGRCLFIETNQGDRYSLNITGKEIRLYRSPKTENGI